MKFGIWERGGRIGKEIGKRDLWGEGVEWELNEIDSKEREFGREVFGEELRGGEKRMD